MIDIFVPTYGRHALPILKLLKDKDIRINLCLRHEKLDDRKYFSNMQNVRIVDLGYGIKDIGETRKRIINYCISKNMKYCIMFDDGLTDVVDLSMSKQSISKTIEKALSFLKEKQEECQEVFCYTFFRQGNKFLGVSDEDEYFVGFPLQAEIIDLDYIRKYKFNFQSMDVCGLEDIAFFADAVKHGLVFVSDQSIAIEGKLPNVIRDGGNHQEGKEEFEKKRDISHARLMKYVGNMYGIMLSKKYRESLGFCLTYAKIDFSYFRDVLVYHRKENKKIIDSKFMIGEDYE